MRRDLELKRFAKDGVINIIRLGGTVGLSAISSILITRLLGVDGKGIYVVALFLPRTLHILLSGGIEQAIAYKIARDGQHTTSIIWNSIIISILLSLISLVIGWGIVVAAGSRLFPSVQQSMLLLALGMAPFLYMRRNLASVYRGMQAFHQYGIVELSYPALLLLLVIFFLVKNDTLETALLVNVGASFLAVLVALVMLRGYLLAPVESGQPMIKLQLIRDLFSYGSKIYFNVAVVFLLLQSDIFLLNLLGNSVASVGIYSISVVLSGYIQTIASSFVQAVMPRIASWNNEEQRTAFTALIIRHNVWLSILMAIAIGLLGKPIITLLYGDGFSSAGQPLIILLPGIIFLTIAYGIGSDFAGRGNPQITARNALVAFVINFILNIFLIPQFDYNGAALASTIAYSYFGLSNMLVFCRTNNVCWKQVIFLQNDDIQRIKRLIRSVREFVKKLVENKHN